MFRPLSIAALLALLPLVPSAAARTRTFVYEVDVEVGEAESAGPHRLWVPVPPNTAAQTVIEIEVATDATTLRRTTEATYGVRLLYAASDRPFRLTARWRVERREVAHPSFRAVGRAALSDEERERTAPFLGPNRLVPVGGRYAALGGEIVGSSTNRLVQARRIYDHVLSTMDYRKDGTGWGRGSSEWACDSRYGNCTDFHALFISLSRSQGIPARFRIGYSLPAERGSGELKGYHCWSWFYLPETGWIAVDISEGRKHPEMAEYYFGNLTEDRLVLTTGRDLTLEPAQDGEPLNYLVHPYAESGGRVSAARFVARYQDLE